MTKAMKKAATELLRQIDTAERVDTEDAIFSSKMLNAVQNMHTAINNFVAIRSAVLPPPIRALREGEIMGAYVDFDRTANKSWAPAEYLVKFGLHISECTANNIEGKK